MINVPMRPVYRIALAFAMTLSVACAKAAELPDPNLTPGLPDPNCTIETLRTTSTESRRIATKDPSEIAKAYAKYGLQNHQGICSGPRGCEVDDRIPLEACGLNLQDNLWIQPYGGEMDASCKDTLENHTKAAILAGREQLADGTVIEPFTIADGQARFFAPDWRVEYQKVYGKTCSH